MLGNPPNISDSSFSLAPGMNLNDLIARLGSKSPSDPTTPPPETPTNSTKFYQMKCRSRNYYTPKLSRQLPLREVEGFCKVEMRHTTSKFKRGKPILVTDYKKQSYINNLSRSIQMQPTQLDSTVRNEMLLKQNHVIRLPKDTSRSITAHSSTCVSPLPEVES